MADLDQRPRLIQLRADLTPDMQTRQLAECINRLAAVVDAVIDRLEVIERQRGIK